MELQVIRQNVQVGYMIDENEQPIKGEPLLFYSIYNNSNGTTISFLNSLGTSHIGIRNRIYRLLYLAIQYH